MLSGVCPDDDRSSLRHQERSATVGRGSDCKLRKPSSLNSSDLDQYRSRSGRIITLYGKLDLIQRKRFSFQYREQPFESTLL